MSTEAHGYLALPDVRRAMLMAAGLGTRMRPFTEECPKALLPLVGVPMAQFALDAIHAAGVTEVVANVHHLAAEAERGLRALDAGGARLTISDERAELLGSGGGVRRALGHFGGEPFFYCNADVISGIDLRRLGRHHARMRARHGVALTLAVSPRAPTSTGYREIRFDSTTSLITALGEIVPDRPYFMGAAVIEPGAFAGAPAGGEFDLVSRVFAPAVASGRAAVYLVEDARERRWFDVGSPELWLDAHAEVMRLLETGAAPELWRRRIERVSLRLAEGIWASRRSGLRAGRASWAAPLFWDAGNRMPPPRELGPRSVIYGGDGRSGGSFSLQLAGLRWPRA